VGGFSKGEVDPHAQDSNFGMNNGWSKEGSEEKEVFMPPLCQRKTNGKKIAPFT